MNKYIYSISNKYLFYISIFSCNIIVLYHLYTLISYLYNIYISFTSNKSFSELTTNLFQNSNLEEIAERLTEGYMP